VYILATRQRVQNVLTSPVKVRSKYDLITQLLSESNSSLETCRLIQIHNSDLQTQKTKLEKVVSLRSRSTRKQLMVKIITNDLSRPK